MSKRYKVVGTQPILGHAPGTTFTAEIDATHEQFLVGIGGLEVVAERATPVKYKRRKKK